LSNHQPGTALAWYVITYDIGRFSFEFMRGDVDRPYLWGFSEAQWVSIMLMCALVCAEFFGVLPFQVWHLIATGFVAVTMIVVALRRLFQRIPILQLLHPYHIKEVAEVLLRIANAVSAGIHVEHTSLGIQVSASVIKSETGNIRHYALSHQQGNMSEETAKIAAKLILQLKHPSASSKLIKGNRGVFHLLIDVSHEADKHVYQTGAYWVVGTGAV
jgi:hypothetical protein